MTFQQFACEVCEMERRMIKAAAFYDRVTRMIADGVDGLPTNMSPDAALAMYRLGLGPGCVPIMRAVVASEPASDDVEVMPPVQRDRPRKSKPPAPVEIEAEAVRVEPTLEVETEAKADLTTVLAETLITRCLADGPQPESAVLAAAGAVALPERALLAAADALGVRVRKGLWTLPSASVSPE